MKSDLMNIFGMQIRWFSGLNVKQRAYVLYFLLSFSLLFVVSESLEILFIIVLNFGNSVRLLRHVPSDGLAD